MKRRYLNLDQFRQEQTEGTKKEQGGEVELTDASDLIVLASQTPKVRAVGGEDSRLIEFRITDETVDRMYDTIATEGWNVKWFKKNPVVLWAHSHYEPPVGRSTELTIDKESKEVRSVTEFTPRDLNPLGYMVYQMYLGGFMHAVSVGFQPKKYAWAEEEKDGKERAEHSGINFLKQELLEYSAVPVPANPNALSLAMKSGVDTKPLKLWAEMVLDESKQRNLSESQREGLEVLRVASSPTGRALILDLGDVKSQIAAVVTKDAEDEPVIEVEDEPTDKAVIKKVVREHYTCGIDTTHEHTTEQEARDCHTQERSLETLVTGLTEMTTAVKAGRVLSKKNEDALRSAAEAILSVLDQVAGEDDEQDDADKSAGGALTMDESTPEDQQERILLPFEFNGDMLRAAVADVVTAEVNRLTGRV